MSTQLALRPTARPTDRRRLLLVAEWIVFGLAYLLIVTDGVSFALAAIGQLLPLTIGTLLVIRRPENPIGSMLTVIGWGWASAMSADVVAERLVDAGSTIAAGWLALIAMLATAPLLWLTHVAVWLVFPDGHPATPVAAGLFRWSRRYLVVPIAVGVFATPVVLGPGAPSVPHPFLDPSTSDVFSGLWMLSAVALFAVGFVAIGLLLVRVRHAGAIERRQILVVGVGVPVYLGLTLFNAFVQPLGAADERSFLVLDAVATGLLASALGIAIVRYRLFELGRIFRRSLVYAGLAVVIGAIYVAIVVGVGAYYDGGANVVLSIAATIAVALVFQPARRQLERWANRLVYGPRAEPQEVLSRFARRAAELPDDELLQRIPELVAQGTAARRVALWTRTDDGFRCEAVWPPDTAPHHGAVPTVTDVADLAFDVPGVDRSLPVVHEGELLGGVSVEKEPGEILTPAEVAMLDDLAGALGVAMRNVRLAEDLRLQVAALERSRERLLTAADDTRRSLEWTLDSGPLQRLVALKVKLGPVRLRAQQRQVDRVADVLASLESETDDAIRSIRRFASGVYPPELESAGLSAAIDAHAEFAPFELTVRDDEHPIAPGCVDRDVASAVYFTVLEALQNAAKHAGPDHVEVTFRRMGPELGFAVVDDGAGFDANDRVAGVGLVGMADRLDTVGGRLEIDSRPGSGTRITGWVPLAQSDDGSSADDVARAQLAASPSMLNDDFGMNAVAPASMAGPS